MTKPMILTFNSDASISGNMLSGYAHIYGTLAKLGNQYEEMKQGAFDKALKKSDVRAFYQHNPQMLLGRQSAGTLRLNADTEGLAYELDLPNTTYANDLRELVARGDLTEMSFAFIPGQTSYSKAKDGLLIRSHISVRELVDISPVSIPAFSGTSINMRSRSYEYESVRSQLIRLKAGKL